MPSFDVVSEINLHELANAVDQTQREIVARFDFKGADAQVIQTKENINLEAENEFQIKQMLDILYKKLAKRGIDVTSLEEEQLDAQNRRARLVLKIKQGIETETGKKIVKLVKDTKLKVQATIQADQVRVTGKKLDDLQQVIATLRGQDFGLPLQFTNFRD